MIDQVTIIILAGGGSSRMGEEKGLVKLSNKMMIEHVVNVAKQYTPKILLISNRNQYDFLRLPTYSDIYTERGPLGGIHSGLIHSDTYQNVILSCDIPYVSVRLINYLLSKSEGFDSAIPKKENQIHPLIGVYTKNCLPVFEQALQNNENRLQSILEKVKLTIVDANQFDEKEFRNLNTPQDIIDQR